MTFVPTVRLADSTASSQSRAHPPATSPSVRRRMQNTPTRDTPAELALRSELHQMGLRYRVDVAPLSGSRRRADVVFRRAKVAVFVDGCYWHGCPHHGSVSGVNAEWWLSKIERTRERDRETDIALRASGWKSMRVWEHEDPGSAALRIAREVTHSLTKRRGEVRRSKSVGVSRSS